MAVVLVVGVGVVVVMLLLRQLLCFSALGGRGLVRRARGGYDKIGSVRHVHAVRLQDV